MGIDDKLNDMDAGANPPPKKPELDPRHSSLAEFLRAYTDSAQTLDSLHDQFASHLRQTYRHEKLDITAWTHEGRYIVQLNLDVPGPAAMDALFDKYGLHWESASSTRIRDERDHYWGELSRLNGTRYHINLNELQRDEVLGVLAFIDELLTVSGVRRA